MERLVHSGLVKIPRMCLSTGYFFWGGIFAFVGAVCPGVIFTWGTVQVHECSAHMRNKLSVKSELY